MKKIILIISILLTSLVTKSQTQSYKDSLAAYNWGLYQVQLASEMKNRQDTIEGRMVWDKIVKSCPLPFSWKGSNVDELRFPSGTIRLQSVRDDLRFYLINNSGRYMGWSPDVYKKPTGDSSETIQNMIVVSIPIEEMSLDSIPVIERTVIMPDGNKMKMEDFIALYGKQVAKYYFQ